VKVEVETIVPARTRVAGDDNAVAFKRLEEFEEKKLPETV